ncbi:MAG: hypothetical protein JNJ58_01895 [Chitinophagaceae bacterium]|nr:hypothetical protein [Chitinophagaceae bacterium]
MSFSKSFSLLTFALLLTANGLFAQNAKISSAEVNKISRPCVTADYGMSYEIIDGAFKKKFTESKFGSGDKTKDGYRVYKGIIFQELSTDKVDLYFRVEDRKPNTSVYLLLSKGYDNFLKPETDSLVLQQAVIFLNAFVKDATAFQLNRDIEKQQETILKAESKVKDIQKDGERELKNKSKVESKISKNGVEQSALKTEMESEKKQLEVVKAKTATLDQMEALKKEVGKQESSLKKAEKNYFGAVKDGEELKSDLQKAEQKIADNKIEEEKAKGELSLENKKLEELKVKLSNLK